MGGRGERQHRGGTGKQDRFERRHHGFPSPVGHAAFFSLFAFAFNHFAICSLTSRPSRMPQTTRLAPRTMSPAAKTPGRLVIIVWRSEEHTSELQSLMRISYAVFCLKKKTKTTHHLN